MIEAEYDRGDIFEDDAEALICPVNVVGTMGAGLALRFSQAFPGLLESYKLACRAREFDSRGIHVYQSDMGRKIVCLPTKRHWRQFAELQLICSGLEALKRDCMRYRIHSLAIPAVGCGLGRLDWKNHVYPTIRPLLEDLPCAVYVYHSGL